MRRVLLLLATMAAVAGLSGCGAKSPVVMYTLTLSCEGSGSISPPSGRQYAKNALVTLTPTPGDGWSFDGWGGPDGPSVRNNQVVMDADKSITVVFKKNVPDEPYTASGRVIAPVGGQGVAGVTISFDNGASPVVTDGQGRWAKSDLHGTVKVTPTKDGWTFDPKTRVASSSTSNDFTGANPIVFDLDLTPYQGPRDLIIMNPDGSNQTNLTNGLGLNMTPALSPDCKKIAFSSTREGLRWDLCVINVDGTGYRDLTSWHGPTEYQPSWSPSGDQIVYTHSEESSDFIWAMNADGTNIRVLTSTRWDSNPSWSPNQNKIAFESYRDGTYEIYVMDTDGTHQTRLTDTFRSEFGARYSPDGSKLVYMATSATSNYDIWVMNSDGTGQVQLTNDPGYELWPCWSPDGSKIIFTLNPMSSSDVQLWTMNADGTGRVLLVSGPGRKYATW